jgi:hypothetical protein
MESAWLLPLAEDSKPVKSLLKGDCVDESHISDLGPLPALAGTWEDENGDDIAPADDRGTENRVELRLSRVEPSSSKKC